MDDTSILEIAAAKLENPARQIGLYQQGWELTDTGVGPGLVVVFDIGDVAFSTRVQDPEVADVDAEFRQIAVDAANDDFLDERQRIVANIEAGRDPLDDGD